MARGVTRPEDNEAPHPMDGAIFCTSFFLDELINCWCSSDEILIGQLHVSYRFEVTECDQRTIWLHCLIGDGNA